MKMIWFLPRPQANRVRLNMRGLAVRAIGTRIEEVEMGTDESIITRRAVEAGEKVLAFTGDSPREIDPHI